MIESITIINYRNETVGITLRSPASSGFFIESIEGLGPPKAQVNTTLNAGDGAIFNTARAEPRNIVFTLGMYRVGTLDIEDLRQKSYRMFPLKSQVRIEVQTTNRRLYATGYVESNEPDIFTSQQKSQISILCMDPFMYDADEEFEILESTPTVPAFEFPFSDESSPGLEFSLANDSWKWLLVNNIGDQPVGAIFEGTCGADTENYIVGEWSLDGTTYLGGLYMQPLTAYLGTAHHLEGDVITFSTVKGDKYATVLREGTTYDVFPALIRSNNLRWFELQPGLNLFRFGSNTGLDQLSGKIYYKPKYEGV